jgi:hypothetical protein
MIIGGRNLWSVLDEYLTATPSRTLTTCGKVFEWKSGMNFQLTAKSVLNWGIQTYDQRSRSELDNVEDNAAAHEEGTNVGELARRCS